LSIVIDERSEGRWLASKPAKLGLGHDRTSEVKKGINQEGNRASLMRRRIRGSVEVTSPNRRFALSAERPTACKASSQVGAGLALWY